MSGKLGQAQSRQANRRLRDLLSPLLGVCPLPLSHSESRHPSSNITHTMWSICCSLSRKRFFYQKQNGNIKVSWTQLILKIQFSTFSLWVVRAPFFSLIALGTFFTRYAISLEALGAQMATSCPLGYNSQLPGGQAWGLTSLLGEPGRRKWGLKLCSLTFKERRNKTGNEDGI